MSKRIWIPVVAFLFIAAVAVLFMFIASKKSNNLPSLDAFAQCLSQKGATMYGAYWCPHCQAEKALFGPSFKYVNYVECTQDVNKCIAAKITGYPTWIYPDGKTYVGTQSLKDLSSESSCALPAGY